ncbi:MAG: OmpA family protein [Bacteroidota bacterium]
MLNKVLLPFFVAFIIVSQGIAQENEQDTLIVDDRVKLRADEQYDQYSFSPAIDIYKKVLDKGYVSSDLLKRLGNSYYFNAKYKEAADIYEKLVQEYPNEVEPDYLFRYSQSLKTLGDYEKSKSVFDDFKSMAASLESLVYEEDYLEKIKANSGRYEVKPFPYNSKYTDFAASFYEKGLIFSSDRDTGSFARYRHTWNSKDFLDLYKVDADSSSMAKVTKLPGEVNTRLHESTSVVSKDGQTMYFTRNNFLDGKKYRDTKGVIRLKIYSAELVNGEWTNIIELPFNDDSYSVAHPVLSPDGKRLYFVSDMPGSLGESDIFMTQIIGDGTYGPIVNLGKTINTRARETFPYITQDGVLYFSSDGHPGLGGLDVFATKIAFDEYDQPIVNVGEPVNSPFDDFAFIWNESEGYFSSNREGGMGEDDIYAFEEKEPLVLDCLQEVTGTVYDRISNEVLAGATVKIIDEENKEISSTLTDAKGNYVLMLDCSKGNFVRASRDGYVPAEEYLTKSYGKPRIVDFYLERDVVTGGFGDDLAKLLQLSTIYFDLNKFDIRPDAEIEIQKVIVAMEKYPSLKIKVNAHTDSRGNDAYNLWLSQKRAESTVAYMISKGIAAERLQGEGFGEKRLVNECANGIACSREKHQLNRRSEFIIFE